MATITTVLVDDEAQSRNFLFRVLEREYTEIEIVGEAVNVDNAIKVLNATKPKLVFLDVMLGDQNAFELLERISPVNFEIIFTTAHNEFAVKAFKFNALDYLLKPVNLNELHDAVEKVKTKLSGEQKQTNDLQIQNLVSILKSATRPIEKIAIPSLDGFVMVPVSHIIYCESDANYTIFHLTDNRKMTSSYTLRQYDEILSTQDFFRAHKSYLINLAHINRYLKLDGGMIVMSNGKKVEISRRNKEKLIKLLRGM